MVMGFLFTMPQNELKEIPPKINTGQRRVKFHYLAAAVIRISVKT